MCWLYKKVKYDGYWAFFSTLGGAYSSLGEECIEHVILNISLIIKIVFYYLLEYEKYKKAQNAEVISLKQLTLAKAFDDPNAICRCKLFLSFSFIQLGKYKQAKIILK